MGVAEAAVCMRVIRRQLRRKGKCRALEEGDTWFVRASILLSYRWQYKASSIEVECTILIKSQTLTGYPMLWMFLRIRLQIKWALTTTVVMFAGTHFVQAQDIPRYRFLRAGLGDGRVSYETALTTRLIEISQSKYGPADIGFVDVHMNALRAEKMIKKGELVHFLTGAYVGGDQQPLETSSAVLAPIFVNEPIYNNLLGYRRIIVRLGEEERFNGLDSLAEFSRFKVGQGFGWADVSIFRFNGIEVVEADAYQHLFPMLGRKRFDYISLAAGEVDHPFLAHPEFKDMFTVVDDVVIFYPFPVHFFVSPVKPELADRLEFALKKMRSSGEFDKFFKKNFGKKTTAINRASTKVFVLKLPGGAVNSEQALPRFLTRATIVR